MSGADEIVVNYAIALRAAGHSPEVLLVHAPAGDDPLAARLRTAGVKLSSLVSPKLTGLLASGRRVAIAATRVIRPASRLIRTNSRNLVFDFIQRYQDRCREFLRRCQPDIVHVMTPDPGAVMLIRAAHSVNLPVVYQEVGMPFHPPGFEEVYQRFASVLPLCSEVATLSPRLAQEMHRVLPLDRAPHVVPLLSHAMANGDGTLSNPVQSKSVRFGFASRLEHLKGPVRLVHGFHIAHNEHPLMELRIAGDGSQRSEILREVRRLGLEEKCSLVGVYTTMGERDRFLKEIDVFVLPSLTEGTPNAIIEAMAHAKPVIATTVGGIPDLVNDDVGILVPPNNQEALGAAMSRLANDPELRARMGRAARKNYEQTFTPQAVLPLLVDFYQNVIDRYSAA